MSELFIGNKAQFEDWVVNAATRPRRPALPSWRHSSMESDSCAPVSPLAMCSECSLVQGCLSNECSDKSLPRLPELDSISLKSLASHYARSQAYRSRPHPVGFALQATPHNEAKRSLPPMKQQHEQAQHHQHSRTSRNSHCLLRENIKYKDSTDYWHIDRHGRETPWNDVARAYTLQFKQGPERCSGGVRSAWHRESRKTPILDDGRRDTHMLRRGE